MKTVTVTHDYPFPVVTLWALVTDYTALAEVMKGSVTFEGLPRGRAEMGQNLDVMVSLFGKLPPQPYAMKILECSDAEMLLCASERGAGVKRWHHTLRVTQTASGSRVTDTIEVDAG